MATARKRTKNTKRKTHEIPFVQYSKKMCTRVCVFWMVYRICNFIVICLRPEVSVALVDLCAGIDSVMMVNMGAYTGNSAIEKVAVALAGRKSEEDEENSNG